MANNGTAVDTRSRVLSWIALGVVYVAWGLTYLAIRVGVGHLPPLFLAGIRYVTAGALLYPIALRATTSSRGSAQDRAKPGAKAWFAGAVIGILLLFAGNGGLTVGETTLPSGFAAVLVATVPLWMMVFAWPVQHQRVTLRSAAGLAVGLGGVIILVGDGTASGRISGVIIVLGAAASWGFGSVLSHRLAVPSHAMLAAAIEMLVGGVVLLAVAAGSGVPLGLESGGQFANGAQPTPQEMPEILQPVVKAPTEKLGRNEPCWCGSGKKFKLCHGAS